MRDLSGKFHQSDRQAAVVYLLPLLESRIIETVAKGSWYGKVRERNYVSEAQCTVDSQKGNQQKSHKSLTSEAGTALSLLKSEHMWVDRHLLSQSVAHIELMKAIALKFTALIGPSRKQAKLTFKNESKLRAERRCIG